jgi:STE24 endopeptidase
MLFFFSPPLIHTRFNKYEPLPEGELKDAIFALAKKLNFPLTKLFTVDGSKRSSHSNAYLYGFFKNKRIVLFDTLIKQMTVPELEAVLGHEIGHWALSHVLQMFAIQQLYFLAMFALFGFSLNDPQLYLSFGFNPSTKPTIIGLMLFLSTIWAPVDKLLSFLVTYNTRRNEFQADQYSVGLNYGPTLKMGLVKMSIENRSNLDPDPVYSLYHYSHPPLLQRLEAIDEGMKKKN